MYDPSTESLGCTSCSQGCSVRDAVTERGQRSAIGSGLGYITSLFLFKKYIVKVFLLSSASRRCQFAFSFHTMWAGSVREQTEN